MRDINEIIVHCTATPEGKDYTVADIDRWHKQKGWKGIGYHYVVYRDGTIHSGRPVARTGAHCYGHNKNSIGVAYVGGLAPDGKTPQGHAHRSTKDGPCPPLATTSTTLPVSIHSRPPRLRQESLPLVRRDGGIRYDLRIEN